jgi:8-oxo-dGTP diphosphatase
MSGDETKVQRLGVYAWITAEGHVLLSLLNRGPNTGKWTLVGGGVEFGESPQAALIREVEEESGIKLETAPTLLDVFSHEHIFEQPNGEKEHMHFVGIIHQIELPKMLECKSDGDGFSSDGTKWFKLSDLKREELNPSVLKVLHRLKISIN